MGTIIRNGIEYGGVSAPPISIVDDLTSESSTSALSANQGRILNESKVGVSNGALTAQLLANSSAVQTLSTSQLRNIKASTTDLTAGTSTLATGDIYIVYE